MAMTHEKIVQALKACDQRLLGVLLELRAKNTEAFRAPTLKLRGRNVFTGYRHCRWMIQEATTWDDSRREKAMRWLSFVQGVLWGEGDVSIDELKQMNMPDGGEKSR